MAEGRVASTIGACKRCGTAFQQYAGPGFKAAYCSEQCKYLTHHPPKKPHIEACLTCGGTLEHTIHGAQYCSPLCRSRGHNPPKGPWQGETLACLECQAIFVQAAPQQRFCSRSCRDISSSRMYRKTENGKRARRVNDQLRRARKRAGYKLEGERLDDRDIFKRDGWRCQLCGCKVNKDVPLGHDRYATIDHILPVTRGGQHTRVNVQACCSLCNRMKSNKVEGVQMRLLG